MQAYKLKGRVDEAGNLVITESVKMPPGEAEIIILQEVSEKNRSSINSSSSQVEPSKKKLKFGVKSLNELLENAPPVSPDFDPEQAKWEYLKDKYKL
ncbi:hypothetical protein [Floridanema evergladense]|uniref:Uncharacterized protein n=1 Tax=Floridaenema evergladense BLCC-F167 TaxID=3153639 RepID=A0ABV4WLA2_9CYAN